MRTERSIKDGTGGTIIIRTHAVQQHKNDENKCKKELKYPKNQNKMLYSISKKYGSRREINNVKKIRAKASKKTNVSSSEYWDCNSSLASDNI